MIKLTIEDMLKEPHTELVVNVVWHFKDRARVAQMLRHIASMVEEGYSESIYPEWKISVK